MVNGADSVAIRVRICSIENMAVNGADSVAIHIEGLASSIEKDMETLIWFNIAIFI
jgi:hypothetical protein